MPRFAVDERSKYRRSLGPSIAWGVVVVWLAVSLGQGPEAAESAGTSTGSRIIAYDIPAQPLDEALDAFSGTSGIQVFYENSLTEGRRAAEVKGKFDAATALGLLLFESGLTARIIATNTISIAKPQAAEAPGTAERQAKRAYVPYYGLMQTGIMKALCANAATRPGDYHVALQYSLNPLGRVERLKLIRSSGNSKRDAAIIGTLQNIMLLPPGGMPQPVTIAIEPAPPEDSAGCASRETETSRVR